jgi:hypothetical protein
MELDLIDTPEEEAIHRVGPKGKAIADEKGIDAVVGNEVPRQFEHLKG